MAKGRNGAFFAEDPVGKVDNGLFHSDKMDDVLFDTPGLGLRTVQSRRFIDAANKMQRLATALLESLTDFRELRSSHLGRSYPGSAAATAPPEEDEEKEDDSQENNDRHQDGQHRPDEGQDVF